MKSTKLFIIAGALTALASSQAAQAQFIGGNAFMKGTYLEVGISACGTFGTSMPAPTNPVYHNNEPNLGFVADASQDGWGAGSPNYCGDYFVPGTPEEGWSVKVDSVVYSNHNVCETSDITGSLNSYSTANGVISAGWNGSVNGLNVTKTTYFPQNALYFVTEVTLTNNSGTTMNNVYYMRNVDPDNEQPWSYDFSTINSIVSQADATNNNVSLVKAVGIDFGCYLGLGTIDSRARVTHGGFANRDAQEVYDGTNLYTSGSRTADESISLSFSLGSLAPGQSVCFAYAYILNEAQLSQALQATSQPIFKANGNDITASGNVSTCQGSPVNLQIEGGVNYNWTWSPAAGLNTTYGPLLIANPASTTSYTATGTSACGTISKVITINVIPNSIAGTVTTTGTCNGNNNGTATVTVTGGTAPYQYVWNTASTANGTTISGLAQGQYNLIITDAAGCQSNASGIVAASAINISAQVTSNVSAPGADNGTATAVATGGIAPYYYYWNTVPQLNEQNAFGLSAGTYTVTVLDQAGCQGQTTVTLTEPAGLMAEVNSTPLPSGYHIACYGGTTGFANLTVTNGTAPYTYAWSNGSTSEDITGLAAGTYSVTVTDANGMQASASVTLTQPAAALQVSSTAHTYANGFNLSCFNGTNGSITLVAAGGTAPYTYNWQNGSTNEFNPNLSAGTHTVTVTDANGCEAVHSTTLTQPTEVVAYAGPDQIMQLGYPTNQNGQYSPNTPQCVQLNGSATGGTGLYVYQWSNSATTANTQVCPTGITNYTLEVKDSNGCKATDVVTIKTNDIRDNSHPNNSKVFICHNTNNPHTISVSANAVASHLAHGDYLGPCTGNTREVNENVSMIELNAAPNPFTNTTAISVTSNRSEAAVIQVFDVNGKMVQTLHNGQIEENQTYEFEFNGDKLPAGLYMCRIVSGTESATIKLVLIK